LRLRLARMVSVESPTELFLEWYRVEVGVSPVRLPGACCLSTIGLDGFPNARFVALKAVREGAFVVTGPTSSRKGVEIDRAQTVALTFWWPTTERQVRVQGVALPISREEAERYFAERVRESQIVSSVSAQGKVLDDFARLERDYGEMFARSEGKAIECPAGWGGYAIDPVRIEFLEFSPDRFHRRTLFSREEGVWVSCCLEP